MITRDSWIDYVAMLTDAELSALAAVLVDEQRKRDEAAQRLADEQAARDCWRKRAALAMVLAMLLAAGHLYAIVAWALEQVAK